MQTQETLKQKRITAKSQADDVEAEVAEIKKRYSAQDKEIRAMQKAINAIETKLEQKRSGEETT